MGNYKESIITTKKSNAPVDPRINAEWSRLENTEAIDNWVEKSKRLGARTTSEGDPGPCQDSQIYVDLSTAEWGQEVAYNSQMPDQSTFGCFGMPNNRALTGCVATAMAEVMNYHHWPNTYNWATMGPNQNETARLMRNAANSVNMIYQCNGSFANGPAIAPALVNSFSYSSSASYGNFNVNTVANEILNFSRPVVLGGYRNNFGGHASVCDGYYQYLPCGSSYSPLLMMNWGWNGDHNGLYSTATGFDPWNQGIYFTNVVMVTNIRH